MLSGDSSYSRNVQYRMQDLLAETAAAYYDAEAPTATQEEKWLSADQFLTSVKGQAPCDEATETRNPSTMSELLFFFPRPPAYESASSGGDEGALSYTSRASGAVSLDEWTHIRTSQPYSPTTDTGIVEALANVPSDVLVYGRTSLEARYAFKLPSTLSQESLNRYIGRAVSCPVIVVYILTLLCIDQGWMVYQGLQCGSSS